MSAQTQPDPVATVQTQVTPIPVEPVKKEDYYLQHKGAKTAHFILGLIAFFACQMLFYWAGPLMGYTFVPMLTKDPYIMQTLYIICLVLPAVVQLVVLIWVATKRRYYAIGFLSGFILSICLSLLLYGSCLLMMWSASATTSAF